MTPRRCTGLAGAASIPYDVDIPILEHSLSRRVSRPDVSLGFGLLLDFNYGLSFPVSIFAATLRHCSQHCGFSFSAIARLPGHPTTKPATIPATQPEVIGDVGVPLAEGDHRGSPDRAGISSGTGGVGAGHYFAGGLCVGRQWADVCRRDAQLHARYQRTAMRKIRSAGFRGGRIRRMMGRTTSTPSLSTR